MTDTEITSLAREYAEETHHGNTVAVDFAIETIRFLLRRFAFVEKDKVGIWIDPKDELPQKDECVEVCICRYDGSVKYHWEASYNGDGTFTDNDGFKDDCISYWMRIPDAPKPDPEIGKEVDL